MQASTRSHNKPMRQGRITRLANFQPFEAERLSLATCARPAYAQARPPLPPQKNSAKVRCKKDVWAGKGDTVGVSFVKAWFSVRRVNSSWRLRRRRGGLRARRSLRLSSKTSADGIVTSAPFTCQTRQAPVGSDEENQ
jgi:hypothetical protein